jgi:pyruvate dehydrogenase E2 component (dihydrolipoamide acetyltransferase)
VTEVGVKGETTIVEPDRARRALGRRAAEVRATVPDLELGAEVEMSACVALMREHGWSSTTILVRACALALRAVPAANAAYRDGRFERYSRINVGVTLPGEGVPLTPTVFDADRKQLAEIDAEIAGLAQSARAGRLTSPELSGATFTLVDLGPLAIDRPGVVIAAGQAAAVAAGTVREVPVVRQGAIVPGHVMALTLACDHRILWGAEAARFLTGIKEFLQEGNL